MNEPENPWQAIPLDDYEDHMSDRLQSQALSELFREALDFCRPRSVAMLGVAGGNGLEHIDPGTTTRIVGLDLNRSYLTKTRHRHGHLPGLELHQFDLSTDPLVLPTVDLVHAALIFEHAGVDRALENALSLVSPGGRLSIVLQLPYPSQERRPDVPSSIRGWPLEFTFIDPEWLRAHLEGRAFALLRERRYPVPGAEFWPAIFAGPVS